MGVSRLMKKKRLIVFTLAFLIAFSIQFHAKDILPFLNLENQHHTLAIAPSSETEHIRMEKQHTVQPKSKPVVCVNAASPLHIQDYTGTDQVNHPKVLYFSRSWNNYRYWMSYTPYPKGNDDYENPSIAVSNDGKNWHTPPGLHNPISGVPGDVRRGGHFSDPHLAMHDDTMQFWYRYNPANARGTGPGSTDIIYMMWSHNGVKWSDPILMFKSRKGMLSPAVLYEGSICKMWYSDGNGKLFYRSSDDLKNWTKPVLVNLVIKGYNIWHQDVIKNKSDYKIIFCAYKIGQYRKNNQCLYYADSTDGVNFTRPVLILSPSKNSTSLDNQMIYRSSLVQVGDSYRIYYSAMNHKTQWHIFETEFNLKALEENYGNQKYTQAWGRNASENKQAGNGF